MLADRIRTAVLIAGVFLSALYGLPASGWAVFVLLLVLIAAHEWSVLAHFGKIAQTLFVTMTLAGGVLLLPQFVFDDGAVRLLIGLMLLTVPFWVLLVPCWLVRHQMPRQPGLLALIGWLVILPLSVALMRLHQISPTLVLLVVAVVVLADTAAYFCGKRWGRHKLAPAISPGKTWEGVAGALLAVLCMALALCWTQGWSAWMIPGFLLMGVISVMGDLFESLLKRQAGRKDSGRLLPGHGGLLDRLDGLIPVLVLVTVFIEFPWYLGAISP